MTPLKYIPIVFLSLMLGGELFAQSAEISPQRKQAIDSLALEKVKDLSKYISIIGNKKTAYSEATRVMDRAGELFASDSEMGVSSLSRKEINYYKVREYFERLMALNYDRVKIQWYDIHYISDLERQPDGRYVGVVTIYQLAHDDLRITSLRKLVPDQRLIPSTHNIWEGFLVI